MNNARIAFIGAGNMASSIIGGLLESGHSPSAISAAAPSTQSLQRIAELGPIATHTDNAAAAAGADVLILAVKPQVMAEAAESIASAVQTAGSVVISIAAGITIKSLQARLGDNTAIVRCMPNTPSLLRCGASGLYANTQSNTKQRELTEYVLSAVGLTRWVEDEANLDAITALSGSGPAYFFLFIEAMIDAACELGLDRQTATELAQQTALGSARMALESDVELAELRRRVTSPGGTTERAIQSFEDSNLREVVAQAVRSAAARAAEMAQDMG